MLRVFFPVFVQIISIELVIRGNVKHYLIAVSKPVAYNAIITGFGCDSLCFIICRACSCDLHTIFRPLVSNAFLVICFHAHRKRRGLVGRHINMRFLCFIFLSFRSFYNICTEMILDGHTDIR